MKTLPANHHAETAPSRCATLGGGTRVVRVAFVLGLAAASHLATTRHAVARANDPPDAGGRSDAAEIKQKSFAEIVRWSELQQERPLGPMPEDRGPLRPGEAEQLMAFARQHALRPHRFLSEVRARNPVDFESKLERAAPHLRMLMRLSKDEPRLMRLFVAHAEAAEEIGRARRMLHRLGPNSPRRAPLEAQFRQRVAERIELEDKMAAERLASFEQQVPGRVDAILDFLLAADDAGKAAVDELVGVPPDLRAMIDRYRSARFPQEREAIRQRLHGRIEDKFNETILRRHERLEQFRKTRNQRIAQTVERMLGEDAAEEEKDGGKQP